MTRIGERTAVMHSRKSPIIIVLALVAVLLACTAFIILLVSNSADKTGTLSGNVVDASDSTCLKGVTVTAIDQDRKHYTSPENSDTTGDDGGFHLELPPNDYTLLFEADGFATFESSASYTVNKNKDTMVDEAFRLAAVEQASDPAVPARSNSTAADSSSDTASNPPSAASDGSDSDTDTANAPAADSGPASKQAAVSVKYVVYCEDEYGNLLSRTTNTGTVGSAIVVDAPQIADYIALSSRQEIILSANESSNVVTFYYESSYVEEAPRSSAVSIPPDAVTYGGHSYYADKVSCESISSYWDAENYCESLGGHLAVITDSELNQFLYEYVFNTLGYESAYFGLTRSLSEDEWYWVDGAGSSYRNWSYGQPDNQNGKENYALFYYKDKPYTWNDGDFGPDENGTVTFLMEWDTE